MRKNTIVRFFIVKYVDVGNGQLFPRSFDGARVQYMRKPSALARLHELQSQDFANGALYGLGRATFPADFTGDRWHAIER